MKRLSSGIVAAVLVLSVALALGATQQFRSADRDVAIGTFTCTAVVNGELNTGIAWEGTTGIVGTPEGLSIDISTVTEAAPETSCQAVADDLIALAGSLDCTVTRVRAVGFTREFSFVCSDERGRVITAIGEISSKLAEVIP
jgi:hypothetical protein